MVRLPSLTVGMAFLVLSTLYIQHASAEAQAYALLSRASALVFVATTLARLVMRLVQPTKEEDPWLALLSWSSGITTTIALGIAVLSSDFVGAMLSGSPGISLAILFALGVFHVATLTAAWIAIPTLLWRYLSKAPNCINS